MLRRTGQHDPSLPPLPRSCTVKPHVPRTCAPGMCVSCCPLLFPAQSRSRATLWSTLGQGCAVPVLVIGATCIRPAFHIDFSMPPLPSPLLTLCSSRAQNAPMWVPFVRSLDKSWGSSNPEGNQAQHKPSGCLPGCWGHFTSKVLVTSCFCEVFPSASYRVLGPEATVLAGVHTVPEGLRPSGLDFVLLCTLRFSLEDQTAYYFPLRLHLGT